ncbi:serine protease inhibitor dipetalogastin-like [Wyeomyia smithii]|uniref:serine protease inhibitor dipetalogastin-like n=1 Tax=Wyeomyia smithii TaxID=174621 RepID=UPI002468038D|nr:serine protease inhibitor dipetalogastin-like [Wyeomyia smithii]
MKLLVVLLSLISFILAATEDEIYMACKCTLDYNPICASDGQTYANECDMRCENVKNPNFHAYKVADEPCTSKEIVLLQEPVAGRISSRLNHSCRCSMHSRKVLSFILVSLMLIAVHAGVKTTTEMSECVCPRNIDPVCASDGNSYTNKCVMECAESKSKTKLTVAIQGWCPGR